MRFWRYGVRDAAQHIAGPKPLPDSWCYGLLSPPMITASFLTYLVTDGAADPSAISRYRALGVRVIVKEQ